MTKLPGPDPASLHDGLATERALRERVKELSCLYGISLEAARDAPLIDRLQGIIRHLPPAWQHPDAAAARIVLDDDELATEGWSADGARQSAPIVTGGRIRGVVELAYCVGTATAPLAFLREERDLIEAVARKVSLLVERVEAEEERERLRDQLRHADRLATVGRMAAGLGHELNEPLSSVLGFAQLLAKDESLSPGAAEDVRRIVNATLRAREIVRRLMLFVRPTPPRREPLDPAALAADVAADFAGRARRQGVSIGVAGSGVEEGPDEPPLVADAAQLRQVLVNLVVNALHAMPEGGTLTIEVDAHGDPETVVVRVRDTGVGMDERVRHHLFEPFFTTRDVGEGTGLGLAVVHGIVQAHDGTIDVESTPRAGTTFTIRLPRRSEGANR